MDMVIIGLRFRIEAVLLSLPLVGRRSAHSFGFKTGDEPYFKSCFVEKKSSGSL